MGGARALARSLRRTCVSVCAGLQMRGASAASRTLDRLLWTPQRCCPSANMGTTAYGMSSSASLRPPGQTTDHHERTLRHCDRMHGASSCLVAHNFEVPNTCTCARRFGCRSSPAFNDPPVRETTLERERARCWHHDGTQPAAPLESVPANVFYC